MRFGWRRVRKKIAAIYDCDFWCSQIASDVGRLYQVCLRFLLQRSKQVNREELSLEGGPTVSLSFLNLLACSGRRCTFVAHRVLQHDGIYGIGFEACFRKISTKLVLDRARVEKGQLVIGTALLEDWGQLLPRVVNDLTLVLSST